MTTTDFYTLKDKADELLLAALDFALLLAPYGTEIPESIADENGDLKQLPDGWFTVGECEKKAGVDLAPDMKVEGPEGYGSRGRRRDFITDESFTIDVTAQESRIQNMNAYYDLGEGAYKQNVGFFAKKRRAARVPEYSGILLGYDGEPGKEIYPHFVFPKLTMEKKGKQSWSETDAIKYPYTLAAKDDPKYGSLFGFGIAGRGFTPELAKRMGITGALSLSKDKYKFTVNGATGGTYTLTIGGKTTQAIEFNAEAVAVQAAIRAAGETEATVTGTAATGFVVSKVSAKPQVTATALTGGDFPKTVEVTVDPS